LNRSWEARDVIMHPAWSIPLPATLEGQVARFADRIAYVNHDVDDAVRAGLLRGDELPGKTVAVLGERHGTRINTLVTDLVAESEDAEEIRLSPNVLQALDLLRAFLFRRVYLRPEARAYQAKAVRLVRGVFSSSLEDT